MADNIIWFFVIIIGIVFGIALLVSFAAWMNDFSRELKHLNNEIDRTDGEERRYWIAQKRRLWLSILPFIRY